MQGPTRKIVQATLYELIAISVLSPALAWLYGESLAYSGALSVMLSASALLWNMLFNYGFEYWEARQRQRSRTWQRRLLHSLGFEGGLTLMLLPLIAWWLAISWWQALATNLGLFVFFFFYALVFQWAFDRVFDVPDSAKQPMSSECSV
ncbi:PACE efflux transporter [Pseudomonas sp. DWP3-1-2]|uniref:PACE efflux transporter n=1 Tax=Pseudomonas sp. DWP3-1-2 TaxID=2804645 RepID=UPI003CF679A4